MKRFPVFAIDLIGIVLLTGCTMIHTQQEVAEQKIRLTTNPAEMAGCQSKGVIFGLSQSGFKVLHGGEWIAEEVTKRGGNAMLLPPSGIMHDHIFGGGEAYFCPTPTVSAPTGAPTE
jgi:hypothetical protein